MIREGSRGVARTMAAVVAAALATANAYAQSPPTDHPQRAIRLFAPGPPGGTTDYLARAIATRLSERVGQPVIVENRPGGGTAVAMSALAKAPPDGYTLGVTYTAHTVGPAMQEKLAYDPIGDFAPVMLVTSAPLVLVVPAASPVRVLADIVTAGKARSLSYGSAGIGSGGHLSGELLRSMSGMSATHVPYKGAGPAAADLVAGHLDFQFAGPVTVQGFVQTGRLRALAVTSARRSAWMPELPTVAELGYAGFEVVNWFGVLAPARTPALIVDRLNGELRAMLAVAATREMLTRDGSEVVASTPEAFGRFLRDDLAKWTRLAKVVGLKAD